MATKSIWMKAPPIWRNRFSLNFGNILPFVPVPMCNSRQRWVPNFEKADLVFYQHNNARLKYFRRLREFRSKRRPKDSEIAIGFFLRTPSIPVYGCGLLACFGMGGWETLIWNRIVRTRYPEWVSRPSFIIGQFDLKGLPARSADYGFCGQNQGGNSARTQNWRLRIPPRPERWWQSIKPGGLVSDPNTFRLFVAAGLACGRQRAARCDRFER